ncbi:MAG: type II toxin-antitoxin system VapC family toxin [Planctomycetes bacterium]|nr:type II toxin-antitoxin system VapC family toxin [Planctomycetota bacterium]
MIFVDTGAWYAAFVPQDADHKAAREWRRQNREQLLTTDYVLTELLTLLRAKGENMRAVRLGEQILSGDIASLERVTADDVREAFDVFKRFGDKAWSFVDCTSYVVMKRLGIKKAFAFDHHFRQFGTVQVVP